MKFTFRHRPAIAGATLVATLALVPLAAQHAPEKVDYEAIYKIKAEGFQRSQIMNVVSWLTDVYGPRLTNSPGFRKSGEWAVKQMTEWGLANAKLEPWVTPTGPFGRGWSNDQFYMQATTPGGTFPIHGMSTAWTAGTNGAVKGEAVHAVIETPEDLTRYKGQLRGKFVLTSGSARGAGPLNPSGAATPTRNSRRCASILARARPPWRDAAAGAPAAPAGRAVPARKRPTSHSSGRNSSRTKGSWRSSRPRTAATAATCCSAAPPRTATRRSPTSACRRSSSRSSTTAASHARSTQDASHHRSQHRQHLPQRHELVQCRRRDPRHRQGGRDRDARRALRFVARRHGRDRQCGRIGRHDGSDAHPEAERCEAAADGSDRPVGRRGAGPARLARLRHRAFRRSRDHGAQARAREVRPATSTSTTARAPSAACICRATKPWRRSSRRG